MKYIFILGLPILVRVHLPLEQGLRRGKAYTDCSRKKVRVHLPLEQGLRQLQIVLFCQLYEVRVHLPLEQGLRHNGYFIII